uniref:C3 and PZP like alpha-2-macroglobulin domain containing 8 n=1 Tax=Myotis lucifugus TaxID=59463 RepID=G1PPU5_MYOLU
MWGALLGPLLGLLLLLSPRDSVHAARPQAPGYLITAPSVFRSGVEEVISVTIFNSPREVMVQAQLVAQGEAVAWSQGAMLDKGTIKLKVPTGLRGQALLKVWGRSRQEEEGTLFHNQTSVSVDARGASVFIQTDKPVYRPQHRVLISVFTVTPDLRPISEKLEAYILDPRGSRMMEWRHVEPVCCGITNMTFPLSDQPVLGEWFIFVEMQGHVYNKSFEVQKYALPKFELLIDPPRYIRDVDACETGTVQARYTFGKPVSGTLTINMTVNGVGYYSQEMGCPVLRTMKIHGSQDFHICVRDMIPTDIPEHFRGTVSIWAAVTATDGSQQVAFDDSTPVQKQLVDIRYSKATRKQFKPGLSYMGMVELTYPDGSPAEGVTVQIRAELTPKDNIYTTESVSRGGLVAFEIPSIPTSAQHVWLEAKVTALNGKPVGTQYLPSYLSLSSWYSPSQCYLQLQPPARPLQVGEEARFPVTSTCACNLTLHYEVAARGNIVLSGQQPARITQQRSRRAAPEEPIRLTHLSETEPPPAPAAELSVCMTSLQLSVTPSMVPLSRLLVFYVRENGEGVADSVQFTVETFFENQVSLTYSANETQPGEVVDLRVRAARGSCVCVAVVDKSVYLLRSGFRLTPAQVFQELEEYDVSDAFRVSWEDGPLWWAGLAARRRRRSFVFLWLWGVIKDSGFAFAETGLVVMTDLVSLNHRQDGGLYTDEAVHTFQPHTGSLMAVASSRQPPRAEKRRRTFFPETWVWRCLNISDPSGEETFRVQVPDSITSWVGEAVGLSSAWGLGIATPSLLKTFKPFFVDFTLPPQVVRGEQVKIPLSIYNYMGTCAEVYVQISVPKGTRFVGHPGKRHLTKKLCVASGETEPIWVVLSFSDLGLSNITAKVLAYGETSCCRDGKPSKQAEESYADRVPAGRDHIRRSVIVEPEGAPRTYTYSAFFCPNERVHISTPNKYEFQYVQRPQRLTRFDLSVRAHNDARVALSPGPQDAAGMIEIVLGGHQNTRSWISTSKMGEPVAGTHTAKILSWDEFRTFWISWHGGLIQVGYGPEPSNESVIMTWTLPKAPDVQFIGFSTGWGSMGEFRLWRKMEVDESYSEAFTLGVPHSAIPGSERAAASLIGDVMGPTLSHLSSLLRLPFGCGEQNMIHFAPNVFVLKYLQKTRQLSPEVERETTDHLVQVRERERERERESRSLSWGTRGPFTSRWLTAFVLKSFAQARSFIFIDPRELAAAKGWIVRQQQVDGSFPATGRILNKDIQGGIHGAVPLTAYVVAALLETDVASEVSTGAPRDQAGGTGEGFPLLACAGQAWVWVPCCAIPGACPGRWEAWGELPSAIFMTLNNSHWGVAGGGECEQGWWALWRRRTLIRGLEAEKSGAVGLRGQRGDEGGGWAGSALPVSSELLWDDMMCSDFIRECCTLNATSGVHAEYRRESPGGGQTWLKPCKKNRADVTVVVILASPTCPCLAPPTPHTHTPRAPRLGLLTPQIDVSYNVPDPVAKPSFQLFVNLQEPEAERPRPPAPAPSADDDDPAADLHHQEYQVTLEVCTRWLHAGSSNMAVLEVPLLSGLRADIESLEQV